jgi:hypothetical protein
MRPVGQPAGAEPFADWRMMSFGNRKVAVETGPDLKPVWTAANRRTVVFEMVSGLV